jgi:hypothetical protein
MVDPLRSSYIIAEDHAIALPFIECLSLKRDDIIEKFRAYSNENLLLVESRGEPYSAAALVGLLLGHCGYDEGTRLFHVGRCHPMHGRGEHLAGRVVLINRVVDRTTGRSYLPDILLHHEFPEAVVETAPRQSGTASPASDRIEQRGPAGRVGAPELFDRELSGVFAAALTLLAPHQVYALAAVAPGAETGQDGKSPELIRGALPKIERLISESSALLGRARPTVGPETASLLDALASSMRLTASQTAQLVRLATEAAARGGDVCAIVKGWEHTSPVQSKQERSKRFDELKDRFAVR